jgi:hypothetical protein
VFEVGAQAHHHHTPVYSIYDREYFLGTRLLVDQCGDSSVEQRGEMPTPENASAVEQSDPRPRWEAVGPPKCGFGLLEVRADLDDDCAAT